MEFLGFGLLSGLAISAFIGVLIAQSKNRDAMEGCAWGCLLGPIGWLILALQSPKAPTASSTGRPLRKCPYCAEMILAEANVCKHCSRDVEPLATTEDSEPFHHEGPTEFNKICPGCGKKIGWNHAVVAYAGKRYHHRCAVRERARTRDTRT